MRAQYINSDTTKELYDISSNSDNHEYHASYGNMKLEASMKHYSRIFVEYCPS